MLHQIIQIIDKKMEEIVLNSQHKIELISGFPVLR